MTLDKDWKCLSDAARKTVKMLEKNSVTHVETFFTCTQTTEVTIRNSEILTQNKIDDAGIGIRVVATGNKVGFACTNNVIESAVLETGKKALSIANASSEVPNIALPEGSQPAKVKALYDPNIAEMAVENVVDIAKRAMHAAESFDERVTVKDGRVLSVSGLRGTINNLGVDVEEEETRMVMYISGSGQQNGEVTSSCYDMALTRKANLEPEKVGENVGKMVAKMFGAKPMKSFQGQVVFGPEAVSYQLCDVLIDALKGDNVMSGRSPWAGKRSQMVASKNLTVVDNAIDDGGFSSRSFDDEGCRSQETSLIRNGELQGFLHDASSAKACGDENTGNASRSAGGIDIAHMIIGDGYRTKPEIYASNLTIRQGKKTRKELVSEMSKGVLIESMAGFAQKGSGIISSQLSRAFFVQNGEIQFPIKSGMISGVGFEWLKNVSAVGNDAKRFPNTIVPSLLVENVKVVGE